MARTPVRTTILVDKDLWKRFKIRAIEEGKSASELLENLVEAHLKTPVGR